MNRPTENLSLLFAQRGLRRQAPARPRLPISKAGPPRVPVPSGPAGPTPARARDRDARAWHEGREDQHLRGDRVDWPEPATDFRGRFRDWPVFFDNFLREHQITDILLFGDCRPYHVSARGVAALRGVRTYVLEEGYLRPHWMTLELDGVNGHSRLARNKEWLDRAGAACLPPEPFLPPITATFQRRVRDTARHYIAVHAGSSPIPFYRTHRPGSALMEAIGWGWKYLVQRAARAAG